MPTRFLFKSTPFLITIATLQFGCSQYATQDDRLAHLRILHWNDFHAHNIPFDVTVTGEAVGTKNTYKVGGMGNFVAYLNHYGRGNADVAVLNAGDNFQGTPISGITKGRSQFELMSLIAPDAVVLGNHEFDYGLQSLRESMSIAGFPILAANLQDSATGATFAPATFVKQFGRTKVGIIGLVPPDLPILTLKSNVGGLRMLNVDSVVTVHVRNLKERDHVDLIILLSHMGVEEDTLLTSRRNDIDVIVGGHTHLALHKPIKKNRTIVVQAGQWGQYVGRLDLTVDLTGDSVVSYSGELVETRLGVHGEDSATAAMTLAFENQVDKELNEVIGTLAVDWKRSFASECNIGNWEADVVREFARTDIALINSGSIRENLPAGPINRRNMWQMNPFNNTIVTFSISGKQLMEMLEWQAGKKGEFMQVSGLRYTFDSRKPSGSKVQEATVGAERIEPEGMYSIATNNYVGGHLHALLGLDEKTITLTDLMMSDREILIDYIIRNKTVSSRVEGRIVDVAEQKESPR